MTGQSFFILNTLIYTGLIFQQAGVVFDQDGGAQFVGEVDGQGFGLGSAPASAKPVHSAVVSAKKAKSKKGKERGR